jgi:predicted XRE-type DNA-binding protein
VSHFDTPLYQLDRDIATSKSESTSVFGRIGTLFRRLEIYIEVPPTSTEATVDIRAQIMVEILSFLAIVTKEFKQNRACELISGDMVRSYLTYCFF